MNIDDAMELIEDLRFKMERGYTIDFSNSDYWNTKDYIDALNLAISALKTVDDMPQLITQLLTKEKDYEELLQDYDAT